MVIKNVTVIGGGVLGSQIAYQSAYKGFTVTIYLRSDASIQRTRPKLPGISEEEIRNSGRTEQGQEWRAGLRWVGA